MVEIRLPVGMSPRVKILSPKIEYDGRIHMYASGHLCLYKPKDQPWMETDYLHEKIVPWTAEWLVYYELFKLTGKWHGLEASHDAGPKEQQEKASEAVVS